MHYAIEVIFQAELFSSEQSWNTPPPMFTALHPLRAMAWLQPALLAAWISAAQLLAACDCRSDSEGGGGAQSDLPAEPSPASERPDPFLPVSPSDPRFSQNPALLDRLMATPHGYYRFINRPFAQAVCGLFKDRVRMMPNVNLHGDAHIEQYTVTDAGVGLTDFDDSSFGPAFLDLVRFGGSLYLAAKQQGLEESFPAAFSAFLDGYRRALDDPESSRPNTAFAEAAKAAFKNDRDGFLTWATGLMAPMSAPAAFQNGYERYRDLMQQEHPDLPSSFFEVVRSGRFRLGVGSALDEKYLIRIHGPSEVGSDDLILEYKEVRDLSGIDCIHGTDAGGAFRILVSQTRIGDMPHRFLAQVPRERGDPPGARMYWVHEWAANYQEMEVKDLTTPEALTEVALDVGIQLGKGHPRAIASPLDSQLRRAQRQLVDEVEVELREAVLSLSARTVTAWEQFKALAEAQRDMSP